MRASQAAQCRLGFVDERVKNLGVSYLVRDLGLSCFRVRVLPIHEGLRMSWWERFQLRRMSLMLT